MSTNWKAGDKALFVGPSWVNEPGWTGDNPNPGVIYLVTGVTEGLNQERKPDVGLFLAGLHTFLDGVEGAFGHSRFRKIVPACDRATQEQDQLIPHEGFFASRPDIP